MTGNDYEFIRKLLKCNFQMCVVTVLGVRAVLPGPCSQLLRVICAHAAR